MKERLAVSDQQSDRMINITYWIIITLIVLVTLSSCGGCLWILWLITKAVTA